jgi:hypothetical protein
MATVAMEMAKMQKKKMKNTKMIIEKKESRRIIITRIAIAKQWRTSPHPIILVPRFPWQHHFEFYQHAKSFHTLW